MAQDESGGNTYCRYLEAIGSESVTSFPYPSHRHRCIALGERRIVAPRTQAAFCLSEHHTECPYFSTDTWTSPVAEAEKQASSPDATGLDLSGP
jgi:hypothetical protein